MNRRQILKAVTSAAIVATGTSVSATSRAQTRPESSLGLTRLDHMSINVADFDRSIEWYSDVLGLDVEVSWRVSALNDKRLAYLRLEGVRVVEIVAADPNGTGLRPAETFGQHFGRTGYGHLCFATESVDQTMAALEARGAEVFVQAETYPLGGTEFERRVAFINDPEGNVIEFGEPLRRVD